MPKMKQSSIGSFFNSKRAAPAKRNDDMDAKSKEVPLPISTSVITTKENFDNFALKLKKEDVLEAPGHVSNGIGGDRRRACKSPMAHDVGAATASSAEKSEVEVVKSFMEIQESEIELDHVPQEQEEKDIVEHGSEMIEAQPATETENEEMEVAPEKERESAGDKSPPTSPVPLHDSPERAQGNSGLSFYEQLREDNMRRNAEFLSSLGLDTLKPKVSPVKSKENSKRKRARSPVQVSLEEL